MPSLVPTPRTSRRSGLFVVGTDTAVGKTIVTAGIVAALRRRGHDIGAAKPLQSGALADDPEGDAALLAHIGGTGDPVERITPHAFEAALTPRVAAALEHRSVTVEQAVAAVDGIGNRHRHVIVEGAGGLMVPAGHDWTIADLACQLALPLLVVARDGLGTINHTTLTVMAARQMGLTVMGVVMNATTPRPDPSGATNAELVAELTGCPLLGRVPWLDGSHTPATVQRLIAEHVDLDAVLGALEPDRPGDDPLGTKPGEPLA